MGKGGGTAFQKLENKSVGPNASDLDESDRSMSEKIREALFNVFMQMNKDVSIYHLVVTLYFIVDGIQMLSLPLNQEPSMPFAAMPLGKSIFSVLAAITFIPDPKGAPVTLYGTEIMYVLAVVWMIFNILLISYSVWMYMQRDDFINGITVYRPQWPIRALRTCARVTVLALYVDIFTILLLPFDCSAGKTWGNSQLSCWDGTHILFVVLSVIILPCTFLFAIFVAAMNIDRRPDPKRNLLSQAHGRVAVAMVVLKSVLCTIFVFGSGPGADNWFLYVVALVAGLAWIVGYARFLPYHQQYLNEFQCALGGVFTAAAISGLLANGLNDPSHSVGAWTWLFTAPLAAFVGWAVAFVSRRSYSKRRELGSPFMVELKARSMLADLADSSDSFGGGGHHSSSGGKHQHVGDEHKAVAVADKDARTRDVQVLYDDALSAFTGSSVLELFIATFLGYVRRNRHLELMHLRAAEAKADTSALDMRFFVWERLGLIDEEEAASNTVKTSVLRRLQFDKLQEESDNVSMKARQLILDFWTEACEKRPDMGRMQGIGTDIIATIRQGDNIFRQLMEMASQSAAMMRSYADFLLDIANDPKKALELLQAAEQIEEDESKAHAGTDNDNKEYAFMARAPDFDLSNENVALIRLASDPGRLGMIQDANPAALKMFGYGRRELIGKNIDVIVPEPMGTVHQKFLDKYMATGEETVVNTSRIYFGLHRNGYLFNMSANIRPMEGGFGGVMEEIVTAQANVIFCGEWGRWKVTAGCKTTMSLLGITNNDLKAGNVTIDKLLPGMTDMPEHGKDGSGDDAGDDASSGPVHSSLMNDLINSNGSIGPGTDVVFSVTQWSAAAAAIARAQRRLGVSNAGGRLRGNGLHSRNNTNALLNSITDHAEREKFSAATAIIRHVPATAKLQELAINFLPGPVYFLRWRVAKGVETVDDLMSGAEGNADENDDNRSGSVDSNSVQGSEGDREIDSDDESKKKSQQTPLMAKVLHASLKHTVGGSNAAAEAAHHDTAAPEEITVTTTSAASAMKKSRRVSMSLPESSNDPASARDSNNTASSPIGANGLPSGPTFNNNNHMVMTGGSNAISENARTLKSALSSSRMKKDGSVVSDALEGHRAPRKAQSITWETGVGGSAAAAAAAAATGLDLNADGSAKRYTGTGDDNSSALGDGVVRKVHTQETEESEEFGLDVDKTDDAAHAHARKKAAGSVQSGSSAGSSTITDFLRKGITQRSRSMETSLVGLRRSLVSIFFFVGLMNIASLIVTHVLYSVLQFDMDIIAENGRRGISLQRSYSELQRLEMMAEDLLITDDNASSTKERMRVALDDMAQMHQNLYSLVDETDAAERELYSTPTITIFDLVPGSYVKRSQLDTENRTVNLMNVGLEYIAKARQVYARQDTHSFLINETSGTMFWLLYNGPTFIRNALNQSMLVANAKTEGVATTIMLANEIVLGIGIGLLLIVTIAVMMPAIHAVLLQKASVFIVFLDTPMSILRKLRAKTESKMIALRRANEEAEAGLDVGGAGEADEEEIERQAAAEAAAVMVQTATASSNDSGSTKRSKKRKNEKRSFKRTSQVGGATALRFSWPMLVLAAYYVGTYFWKQNTATLSKYATSEVFYSHQVQFMVGQSNYNIRNALIHCDMPFVLDQHDRMEMLMKNLEAQQDALLYGNEDRLIRPLLKVSASHFHLFMEDGCVENNDRWYLMNDCKNSFFDGLVGKGLQGAYKQYTQLIQRTMDERLEAQMNAATCTLEDVNGGRAVIAENLAEKYLAAGFDASAAYTLDNINSFLDTFKILNILVTIASIIALLIFFFAVYAPMIRRMDTEIKNVRFLLLLFPDEISRVVPAIIAAGKELMKDGHVSAGSSVASGGSLGPSKTPKQLSDAKK